MAASPCASRDKVIRPRCRVDPVLWGHDPCQCLESWPGWLSSVPAMQHAFHCLQSAT